MQKSKKLSKLFSSQPFSDKEGERIISSCLRIILLVASTIIPAYVALKVLTSGHIYAADIILVAMELFYLFLLFILKKGRTVLSGIFFIISAWTALTLMAYFADGVKDIAIVGYIIIIFLATLLTGIRFAYFVTGISIISVWVMGYLHLKLGIMPKGDLPLNYSRDYTVLFLLVLTSIILFARSYNYSYQRINKELEERTRAEQKLSKNEDVLKQSNEELNRSNLQIKKMNEDLIIARDEAEESDRLKTAFLQNISHEIRTPLNGIVGFVNLLQNEKSDIRKQKEYFDYIKSCSGQMVDLVNDIIDIAKIESGSLELNLSECNTSDFLADIENEFGRHAADKGLKFSIDDETGNAAFICDRGKIRQVLNNLVNNALKFTYAGSVSVKFPKSENCFVASISDTGIGIDENIKETIFDRFRQAEEGLMRTFGGSGLGLAISKGNLDFLGGKIWYSSKPGDGSVFSFSVPVQFVPRSGIKFNDSIPTNNRRRLKVLVAEDDAISAIYLKELLASSCDVAIARNGNKAIEMIVKDPEYDCVLMDLKMPVFNGYEATGKIRDIAPQIPVIAVTAFGHDKESEETFNVSFDGYVVKPVSKNSLLNTIYSVVK